MQAGGVVVVTPLRDHDPRFVEAVEDLAIEQFVAKRPVEALVVATWADRTQDSLDVSFWGSQ